MAEAKDDYSGGDSIAATDLNKNAENTNDGGGFRDDINAGETINGATLPVPVYQSTSDNELYASDADDVTKLAFDGFAISNSTDGNPIEFQGNGIISGFSGLDEGELYYVQDAVGTIGKTPGTYQVLVGKAISPTEILIIKGNRIASGSRANFSQAVSTSESDNDLSTQTIGFRPRKITISGYLFSNIDSNDPIKGMLIAKGATGTTGWKVSGSANFADFTMGITSITHTFTGGTFILSIANITATGFDIKLTWVTGGTYAGTIQAQQIKWIAEE